MKLQKLKQYIEILLFLNSPYGVSTATISERFQVPYQTLVSLLKRWGKSGYVKKKIKETKEFGGAKMSFHLTPQGKSFIKKLYLILHSEAKRGERGAFNNRQGKKKAISRKDYLETINQLLIDIPLYLEELGVFLSEETYHHFIEKVKFFS
jgi:DNA-binding PadR family transcriptional regulator